MFHGPQGDTGHRGTTGGQGSISGFGLLPPGTIKELQRLKEGINTMNEILSSMNLPAGLEDTTGGGVPGSLVEKSGHVVTAGGVPLLEKYVKELPDLLQRNTDLLNESERMLREEAESDVSMRSQHVAKWSRTASDKLTATFTANATKYRTIINNATKYRTIINNATQADSMVKEKLTGHMHGMQMLSGGETQLASSLPKGSGGSSTSRLKELMEEVETLKAERAVIESELRSTNPEMQSVFLAAAAAGSLNEANISLASLGQTRIISIEKGGDVKGVSAHLVTKHVTKERWDKVKDIEAKTGGLPIELFKIVCDALTTGGYRKPCWQLSLCRRVPVKSGP